ncbi:hypothetical protein A3F66_05135 [candidate division TM6 bacterium RIFCSPHIGHO2_12_FULL_32_22]|nr:MAG: hypothetical protein A3F66_05135 [candidate division TM6 bacterium RIFCSPHIGHO2_12_FULL_32_22]
MKRLICLLLINSMICASDQESKSAPRLLDVWRRKISDNLRGHFYNVVDEIDGDSLSTDSQDIALIHRIEWAIDQGVSKNEIEGLMKILRFCQKHSIAVNKLQRIAISRLMRTKLHQDKTDIATQIKILCRSLAYDEQNLLEAATFAEEASEAPKCTNTKEVLKFLAQSKLFEDE